MGWVAAGVVGVGTGVVVGVDGLDEPAQLVVDLLLAVLQGARGVLYLRRQAVAQVVQGVVEAVASAVFDADQAIGRVVVIAQQAALG